MGKPAEFLLSPRWKQAVVDFLRADFQDGEIVTHAWLEEHFGLEPITDDTVMSAGKMKERQFKLLASTEAFKSELLEDHQILLTSVFREGYRVTPPGEQTGVTTDRFEGEMKRSFKKAALRLKNVRLDELTDGQRRENMDAIGKLSMLRGMTKQALE